MKNMHGFSLVELMVAVLILAVGLIGLAGLQVAGLRSNQIAYYRSIATQLAYDMADRMKANMPGVRNGSYNNKAAPASPTDCAAEACDSAALAGYDLAAWKAALSSKLPDGKGLVCLPSSTNGTPALGDSSSTSALCGTAGDIYIIRIWWNDDRSGSTSQGFLTSFRP